MAVRQWRHSADLGTVSSLTLSGAEEVFNLQTKIAILLEYPVYAINRAVFSRMNGFGLRSWNLMRKRGHSV